MANTRSASSLTEYNRYYTENCPKSCCPIQIHIDLSGGSSDLSGLFDILTQINENIESCCAQSQQDLSGLSTDISGILALNSELTNMDAFSRQRVGNPYTLYEFTQIQDKNEFVIDEQITGSATSTHIQGHTGSYTAMSVSTLGDTVIRQTREYPLYQPGKSKLVYMTGVLALDLSANTTSRIGIFDGSMGYFVEYSDGIISVVERYNSVDDVSVRSTWDDPLDGTGPSGATVDFSKAQIYMFDMGWLGVGQVRCGIQFGGHLIYYYTFTHMNTVEKPYLPMAKLPLRYEISSQGDENEMRMICGTVISEGGITPFGRKFIFSNLEPRVPFVLNHLATTFQPVVGIRLRSPFPYNRTSVKITDYQMLNTTFTANSISTGAWRFKLRPDISGGSFTWTPYDLSASAVEISDLSGATVTGGRVLFQGYYESRAQTEFVPTTDELLQSLGLTSNISGVSDVLVLEYLPLAGNQPHNLYYTIQWNEYN